MSRFEVFPDDEVGPGLWREVLEPGEPPDGVHDDRLRVSDLSKLARRTRRRIVRAARADDRPTFPRLLAAHLGRLDGVEVVEESWPSYEHVPERGFFTKVSGPSARTMPASYDE